MEAKNTGWQKEKIRKIIALVLVLLLLGASILVTCIPGGWKQVFAFCGLSEFSDRAEGYPFAVHVLDVGKADAVLVDCEDAYLLVDCGMWDDGETVAAYLKKRGISHLDYAVATHPDSDHIGGFPTVLEQIPVNQFVEPVIASSLLENNAPYQSMAAVLEQKRTLRREVAAGDMFHLNGATVEVLSPAEEMESTNDSSVVLKITYGETSFLLMGDAEENAEKRLLQSGAELRADVLKVGHHGSATSTSAEFLQAVSPKMAAISVGEDRNNLPKDEVLRRLQAQQVETYRTDLDGTLLFVSDGETITVMTERAA